LAWEYQLHADRVYGGLTPVTPPVPQTYRFSTVAHEYLDWGEVQGGRNGRPWSLKHQQNRTGQLAWWEEQLGVETMAELERHQQQVEGVLRRLADGKHSPRRMADYAETLRAFCAWALERKYLTLDPSRHLRRLDTTPQTTRRDLTPAEIQAVLAVAPYPRQLLYKTALCSGLRANELRQLTRFHLDLTLGGVRLDAAWTKNRKPGFQVLPQGLLEELDVFSAKEEARALYQKTPFRGPRSPLRHIPDHPLLWVPAQPARTFQGDCRTAYIPLKTHAGKLDFHCWRVTYATLLDGQGLSAKDTQELLRHARPDLTMARYVREKAARQRQTIEGVFQGLFGAPGDPGEAARKAVGASPSPFQALAGDTGVGSSGKSATDPARQGPYLHAIPTSSTEIPYSAPALTHQAPHTADDNSGAPGDPKALLTLWAMVEQWRGGDA
jgi:integrase